MRKMIFCVLMLCIGIAAALTGCSACGKENTKVKDNGIIVENAIGTDREYMTINYGGEYKWFETCIVMQDWLDEETDGTVSGLSNVFQISEGHSGSYDTHVVLIAHVGDESTVDVRHGFWVEDFPLNEEEIVLTFAEAFERVMAVNAPKPHSRQCVLRKPLGAKPCNPQYIFGNSRAQLFVDAVTGEIRDSNPAFDSDDETEN